MGHRRGKALRVLPDTSAWVAVLKGDRTPVALELLRLIEDESGRVLITEPVMLELTAGQDDAAAEDLRHELLGFDFAPVLGLESFDRAARISRSCFHVGRPVRGHMDCLIAAVAIDYDAALLHDDRDYETIAGVSELEIHRPPKT